jgi:hypothetical protein
MFVDKGYKGHGCSTDTCKVFISGGQAEHHPQYPQAPETAQRKEPVIGHMKSDGRLTSNFLKGSHGDEINVLLCAAAYNPRKILNKLRLFWAQWTQARGQPLVSVATPNALSLILRAKNPQLPVRTFALN